jgi:hypothetical protein
MSIFPSLFLWNSLNSLHSGLYSSAQLVVDTSLLSMQISGQNGQSQWPFSQPGFEHILCVQLSYANLRSTKDTKFHLMNSSQSFFKTDLTFSGQGALQISPTSRHKTDKCLSIIQFYSNLSLFVIFTNWSPLCFKCFQNIGHYLTTHTFPTHTLGSMKERRNKWLTTERGPLHQDEGRPEEKGKLLFLSYGNRNEVVRGPGTIGATGSLSFTV